MAGRNISRDANLVDKKPSGCFVGRLLFTARIGLASARRLASGPTMWEAGAIREISARPDAFPGLGQEGHVQSAAGATF